MIKTKLSMALAFLLILAGLISCKKDKTKYPVEIPFENYALTETSCKWNFFNSDTVIVINSNEELQSYITCADSGFPKIDFSKHSLLLTRGMTASSPTEIVEIRLTQTQENKYVLYTKIRNGAALMPDSWNIAIKTKKLFKNDTVKLDVEQIN